MFGYFKENKRLKEELNKLNNKFEYIRFQEYLSSIMIKELTACLNANKDVINFLLKEDISIEELFLNIKNQADDEEIKNITLSDVID